MRTARHVSVMVLAASGVLAGCAVKPPVDPTAESPFCHRTNKRRVIACTSGPVPSLNADAQAKRFAPDPSALTVYVVRRNHGDDKHLLKVQADNGPAAETLPETMVRFRLRPGEHVIAFEFEGRRQATRVQGGAGEVRFARIDGSVWAWKSSYEWATEPEAETRERALKARLVADVVAR